jgi:DNA polymerase-4
MPQTISNSNSIQSVSNGIWLNFIQMAEKSNRMGRIMMHIDMNSYFASVEQQANPFLRGKSIGITGKRQKRSIVATASIEAKRLGVKTAMSTWEAKRVCPSLILYPGDPEKYSDIMHRFNRIYRQFTDRVEEFSVDESFLDLTNVARDYFGATCIALAIRERLKEELGEHITASVGIGPNRLMAKLCSGQVKPNGLTVVQPKDVVTHLDTSKLQDVCGIGPRIERRLHGLGITTFEQLRTFPLETLVEEFKSYGFWLHEAAWGRDASIKTDDAPAKSYGHSYTLPHDTDDPREMQRCLLGLCDRVAWRLRRDGCVARRIHAYIRYGDFTGMGEQHLMREPTANGLTLFKTAWHLIDRWRDDTKSARLLGISASDLLHTHEPISLFKKERKMCSLQHSLDTLQFRYGPRAWTRASLLSVDFKARSSGFHFDHE